MIEILPPHIANQIAAGEVVQRGASIVKELIENAVDAGAKSIQIKVEDGGRTLVNVSDNGSGMSPQNAKKAFLRHATSKIKTVDDLFALRTFGFRGEALSSIAAVAEVELTTKATEQETGISITVRDSKQLEENPISRQIGTSITVRNLFYSVPARRKFLNADQYEAKLCRTEFIRVAMVNPSIHFEFEDNLSRTNIVVTPQSCYNRILTLVGQNYAKKILPLEANTPMLQLSGYVGTPDTAKISGGTTRQYLFVNGRFFRSTPIYKTICDAYGRLLGNGMSPAFFLFLTVDPKKLDVNINPTKTEVKFDDEGSLRQIIFSAVKQTLGRHNVIEAIDFTPSQIEIPTYNPLRTFVKEPKIHSGKSYNPFIATDWDETLIEGFDAQKAHFEEPFSLSDVLDNQGQQQANQSSLDTQLNVAVRYEGIQSPDNRYIFTSTIDGLAVINIARARQRIEYEAVLSKLNSGSLTSIALAIPCRVELSTEQKIELMSNIERYEALGFTIVADSAAAVTLTSIPDQIEVDEFVALIDDDSTCDLTQRIALRRVAGVANQQSQRLPNEQICALLDRLMQCEEPSYAPTGLAVIELIDNQTIDKLFKR